jgi:hypothetical protein
MIASSGFPGMWRLPDVSFNVRNMNIPALPRSSIPARTW